MKCGVILPINEKRGEINEHWFQQNTVYKYLLFILVFLLCLQSTVLHTDISSVADLDLLRLDLDPNFCNVRI